MPTPGLLPPKSGRRLYDIVVQVVFCLPSKVFGTSSPCSSPLPFGSGSKSVPLTIFTLVLGGGGALVTAGGWSSVLSRAP